METLVHLIQDYGLWVVFFAVLLDQGGLPIPAFPPVMVTSALMVQSGEQVWPIVPVAAAAAVLADMLWYAGGRRYGTVLVRWMCRLSLSQDSCVGTTRGIYARWGAPSLIVAKFVPGFAAVATALAGQTGTGLGRFAVYDGLGAVLWAATAVVLGAVFHTAVGDVLAQLEALGRIGLYLVLGAIALFLLWKFWQRQRFLRAIRMARIDPEELHRTLADGTRPLVLDVRSPQQRRASGWIPGALQVSDVADLDLSVLGAERPDEIVVYCDCPNEATAAQLARRLIALGFPRVRPLRGGLAGWRALGLPVEREEAHEAAARPQRAPVAGTTQECGCEARSAGSRDR